MAPTKNQLNPASSHMSFNHRVILKILSILNTRFKINWIPPSISKTVTFATIFSSKPWLRALQITVCDLLDGLKVEILQGRHHDRNNIVTILGKCISVNASWAGISSSSFSSSQHLTHLKCVCEPTKETYDANLSELFTVSSQKTYGVATPFLHPDRPEIFSLNGIPPRIHHTPH